MNGTNLSVNSAFNVFLFIWFLNLGLVQISKAQFSIREGQLSIGENSVITVQGDLENAGQINHEGRLTLSGNWENKGIYTSNKGKIVLTGSGHQSVDHNDQQVHDLVVASDGNIRLLSDLEIAGKLTLEKGSITPNPNVKLILTEIATIEGGAEDAYINGSLYHTGVGNKFYPIGKNGQYAPVTLTQIAGNEPVVGLEFYDTGLNSAPEDDLQWLGDGFYWHLTHLSGDFNGSPVVLKVSSGIFPFETEHLVLAVSNNLKEGFGTIANFDFQRQGNQYVISSSVPVQNPYITVGIKNTEKNLFYIPNALSPLAPNPEDRAVKVYSEKIAEDDFTWIIRDGWGHIVYTTNSYEEAAFTGWQGIMKNGTSALPGIYHYVMKGKYLNGDLFSKKGNLVLIK